MKVQIGNYRSYFSPYTIVESFTWLLGEERIEKITDSKLFEKISDFAQPAFAWFDEVKPSRIEKGKIDRWDHWSADHTLSLIIVPLLTELRKNLHGAPFVDDADVPECLRTSSAKPLTKKEKENGHVDEFHHQRWEYVIDKIIWAMTQIRDDEWQSQFHTGKSDITWKEVPCSLDKDDPLASDDDVCHEMIQGPNDTSHFDNEGYTKFSAEIDEGTKLFGKYFRNLWS